MVVGALSAMTTDPTPLPSKSATRSTSATALTVPSTVRFPPESTVI
jgi:hypothetical protein